MKVIKILFLILSFACIGSSCNNEEKQEQNNYNDLVTGIWIHTISGGSKEIFELKNGGIGLYYKIYDGDIKKTENVTYEFNILTQTLTIVWVDQEWGDEIGSVDLENKVIKITGFSFYKLVIE